MWASSDSVHSSLCLRATSDSSSEEESTVDETLRLLGRRMSFGRVANVPRGFSVVGEDDGRQMNGKPTVEGDGAGGGWSGIVWGRIGGVHGGVSSSSWTSSEDEDDDESEPVAESKGGGKNGFGEKPVWSGVQTAGGVSGSSTCCSVEGEGEPEPEPSEDCDAARLSVVSLSERAVALGDPVGISTLVGRAGDSRCLVSLGLPSAMMLRSIVRSVSVVLTRVMNGLTLSLIDRINPRVGQAARVTNQKGGDATRSLSCDRSHFDPPLSDGLSPRESSMDGSSSSINSSMPITAL